MSEEIVEVNAPMGKSEKEFVHYAIESFLRGVAYAAASNAERATLLPLVLLDKRNTFRLFKLFRTELARAMEREPSGLKTRLLTADEAGGLAGWSAMGFRRRAKQEGCPVRYVDGENEPRYIRKDVLEMLTRLKRLPKVSRKTDNLRLEHIVAGLLPPDGF